MKPDRKDTGNHIPGISVIVPVYNAAGTLERCIGSILGQSFSDFELILVDDGSTDASPEICRSAACSDGRVRVLHKPNGGVSSARNLGLDSATGKYIAFCDSDDCAEKDWLLAMWQAAGENGLVICGYHIHYAVPEKGLREENIGMETGGRPLVMSSAGEILERALGARLLSFVWNKLFARSVIEASSLRFDEDCRIFEDELFVLGYLSAVRNAVYVPYFGYSYFFPAGFYTKYDFDVGAFLKVVDSIYGLLGRGTEEGTPYRKRYPGLPSIVYWYKVALSRYVSTHTFRQSSGRIGMAKKVARDFHSGPLNHLTLRILPRRVIYWMLRLR